MFSMIPCALRCQEKCGCFFTLLPGEIKNQVCQTEFRSVYICTSWDIICLV
ncbi:hypothetical protein GDO78_022252 [Eleutherodactylus coqui]|uniref:Uncharacterized protein n=1 Tax=Eleutherodactylus coqui TaxID=57060 RepID=A0A8J6C4V2_ELECQ|nr:hypothetical protein GDO78_022252 [Eleutherodactylus coqui]